MREERSGGSLLRERAGFPGFQRRCGGLKDAYWPGYLLDHLGGDCSGAIDEHGALVGVEDGGFNSDCGWAAVEDCVDAAIEVFEDMVCGGWAGVSEAVCAGGGNGNSSGADEREGERMGRHSDADQRAFSGDGVWNVRRSFEEHGQRARPEVLDELFCLRCYKCYGFEHLAVADVDDEGVP